MRIGVYDVMGELGRGAAGVVYAARAPDGREVALKLLLGSEGLTHARFEREIAALRELDHPGIVPLLDEGEHAGRRFLVTARVQGASLEARLTRDGPLEDQDAARLTLALARALAHAHARGLLHRDVKPGNVLLDADGTPRLVDFGLARTIDRSSLTASGQFVGSPGYWSPEQARGERDVGPATDVYGLGATLYSILTGSPPNVGATLAEVFVQTVEHAPRPPSRLRSGVDRELEALCLRCLEKEPGRRPTLAEVESVLTGWLAREPATRRAGPWVVHALIATTGVVGLVGLWALRTRPAAEQPAIVGAASPPTPTTPTTDTPPPRTGAPTPTRTAAPTPTDAPGPGDGAASAGDEEPAATLAGWVAEAERRYDAGDLRGAVAAYDRVIALAPERTEFIVNRAVAQRDLGDTDGALADLALALATDPADARAWGLLGELRLKAGDLQAALEAFDRSLALEPTIVSVLVNRGILHQRRDDLARAMADYDLALQLDPDRVEALVNRASARIATGELELARSDVERALAIEPDKFEARFTRARILYATGDMTGAIEDTTVALRRAPDDAKILFLRARAYRALDQLRPALADYDRLVALHGDQPSYVFNRGNIRRDLGDREGALADFTSAIELGPDELRHWANRGSLRLATGDRDGARADLERALALARDPEVRARVERMLARARR